MNYHPDDFLSLIEAVEEQGGAHLSNEVCEPATFRMTEPVDHGKPKGPHRTKVVEGSGCRRHHKFLVNLLPDAYFVETLSTDRLQELLECGDFDDRKHIQARLADGTPALAKVCATDDAMGLWPRFQDVMHTGESFQET